MIIGLVFLAVGLILTGYAYLSYKKIADSLLPVKQEDLISYYLDLVYNLLPVPFWSGLLGVAAVLVAIIIILFSLPFVF